jgi:hypothetical protein
MYKFKQGDQIEPIDRGRGFERATVLGTFIETKGKRKGKKMYKLKIICGTATIPVSAEVCYKLSNSK